MHKFFYLSWFYQGSHFNCLLNALIETKRPCVKLKSLYKLKEKEIDTALESLDRKKIRTVIYIDELYPKELLHLPHPIWVLSAYGEIKILNEKRRIGFVGSRKPDPVSYKWIEHSFKQLDPSVVVVSGGAIGVDQWVHKNGALNSLKGICVLPVGILNMYPQSLKALYESHLKKDVLFLSQFHPKQQVSKRLFHPRNYLLSALSQKVVIVQAQRKSGTMVTAKFAAELGKDVYVVPHHPFQKSFNGNTYLLDEGAHQIIDLEWIHL